MWYNRNMNNDYNENVNERINDWRNEHGEPDFAFLQSLVDDGGPKAVEKLKSIALDLNVNFDSATPLDELVGRIRLETQRM